MFLKNKIIIVTGVSKGIGKATIEALLKKQAIVVGWGRTKPDIINQHFHFFSVDIRQYTEVEQAYQKTITEVGSNVYGLINNAGLGYFGGVETLPMEQWAEMFDTNVNGLMYCTRVVVAQMKEHEQGHIINIASIAGLQGLAEASGYCATKFAVKGFSHSLYQELRKFGIKVSCIYPGSVETNFFDHIDSIEANADMLQPADIANSIVYLLETPPNCLPIDFEIRPLKAGKPRK